MQLRAFLQQVAGVGVASMADRVVALLLGILLARWLGVEDYGIYAFVMATVSLLLIAARLGLPELIMRDLAASRAQPKNANASGSIFKIARMLIFLVGLATFTGAALIVFFVVEDQRLVTAFYVGLLLLPFLALLDLYAYVLRGLGKAVIAQYSAGLLPSVLVLLFVAILALWIEADPVYVLAVRLVAVIVAFTVTVRILKGKLTGNATSIGTSVGKTGALLRDSLPFLMIGGVGVILSRTDVFMLGFLTDPQDVGVYNAAAQGAILIALVLNISNTIAAPEFSRLNATGNLVSLEQFAVLTARVVAVLAFPITVVAVYWSQELLMLLFGEEYSGGSQVLKILSVGYFTSLLFGSPGFLLNMTGHQTTSFRVVFFSAVLNVLLNSIMIPAYGMSGAATATIIALNIQKGLMYFAVWRIHNISTACFARRR